MRRERRDESCLKRYGGTIGLEWFFPKLLETIEGAPQVAAAAQVWLEAGDWFVWQLVGGSADTLTRGISKLGNVIWSRISRTLFSSLWRFIRRQIT